MSTLLFFLVPALIVALLAVPVLPYYRNVTSGEKAKRSVIYNLCGFFGIMALMIFLPIGDLAVFAAAPEAAAAAGVTTGAGLGYLAAALVTGMSAIGAGIAVASAAPAAIGAISEDPKAFGKAIIFVVLGEGVAIYGLLISILIINKL